GLVPCAILYEIHLVRVVELILTILDGAPRRVSRVERSELRERLDRRAGPERGKPCVEVALHPVLEDDGAVLVAPLPPGRTRADVPEEEVAGWIGIDHAREIRGIDDDGALASQDLDRLGHRARLILGEPSAWRRLAGRRDLVVIEGARDADA